jgi:DNA polymerase kappa
VFTTAIILTHLRLAADQSEINRIIAEASKGSKFYEASLAELFAYVRSLHITDVQNEKKKDKDLTERIEGILKHRDNVVKGVDISTLNFTSVYIYTLINEQPRKS